MQKIKIIGFLILVSTCLTTFAQNAKTLKLYINSFETACQNNPDDQCLQSRKSLDEPWQSMSKNAIEGFSFEPGYNYRLKVTQPANTETYTLKKVTCKKAIPLKELNNQNLVLTKINNQVITNGLVNITINAQNQTISGVSGCNLFNLSYTTNKKQVINTYSAMGTLMACDEQKMKVESEFLNAIQNHTFKIKTENNVVIFNDAKTKTILEFKLITTEESLNAIAAKPLNLIMLDNVGKDYKGAFIKFDIADNRFYGSTGCNNFFGTVTVDANKMIFSQVGLTRKLCIEDEINDNETKIINYLNSGELQFEIRNNTINFYKNNRLVMVFSI